MVKLRECSSRVIARRHLRRTTPLAVAMLCAACSIPATINTKPFDQFSNATQQLDLGADQAFANGVTFTEAGFVEQVAADPKFQISNLLVTRSNEGFATIGQEPTFMQIRKAAMLHFPARTNCWSTMRGRCNSWPLRVS